MPTSEELLKIVQKQEARKKKGELKIFLGMVAGVGKTTAMLKDAHALKHLGKDVVIGLVETHGRKETENLVHGLELLPRLEIFYKECKFYDLDLDEILKRRPEYVLVDELAHNNTPGMRHKKRYQDVLEILDNGINVHTTLNIQHLESRFESVGTFTGITVHEVVPDSILDFANEVLLVDLNPEEIQERLRAGKIYAHEKVGASLQNFFKLENLIALRELSLRFMAERVDKDLREIETLKGAKSGFKVHHKLLVAVFASPFSDTLIRDTRKMAYALNAEWYAIYIKTSKPLSDEAELLLKKNLETVKGLGGEIIHAEGDQIAQIMIEEARKKGITQIVVGQGLKRNLWSNLFHKNVTEDLIRLSRGIDIHVISPEKDLPLPSRALSFMYLGKELPWSIVLSTTGFVALSTLINLVLTPVLEYRAIGIVFLLELFLGSMIMKRFHFFWASLLTSMCWNFFFIPPRFTWVINQREDILMFFSFIFVGLVTGRYLKKLKSNEERLIKESQITRTLYKISEDLITSKDYKEFLSLLSQKLTKVFKTEVVITSIHEGEWYSTSLNNLESKEETILQWVLVNNKEAGKFTETLSGTSFHFSPISIDGKIMAVIYSDLSDLPVMFEEKLIIWETSIRLIKLAFEHHQFMLGREKELLTIESERIYKTLLSSISHELRTPLAAIKGFAVNMKGQSNDEVVQDYSKEILIGVERLEDLVRNILDINRLESGMLKLKKDYTDLGEIIELSINKVKKYHGNRSVKIDQPQDMFVIVDSYLIGQCLENLIKNAFQYSPQDSTVEITVKEKTGNFEIAIQDYGAGIAEEDHLKIFNKFYRGGHNIPGGLGLGLSITKTIIEMHGGEIYLDKTVPKGSRFVVKLPLETK